MTDEDTTGVPYVFVLRDVNKHALYIGAQGGSMSFNDTAQWMADRNSWWPEVHDYLVYFMKNEKRAWEYALHLVQDYTPIYQPTELSPDETPPAALLEAMVDPDPNPPKMVHHPLED